MTATARTTRIPTTTLARSSPLEILDRRVRLRRQAIGLDDRRQCESETYRAFHGSWLSGPMSRSCRRSPATPTLDHVAATSPTRGPRHGKRLSASREGSRCLRYTRDSERVTPDHSTRKRPSQRGLFLVGAPGFEPGTSCPPDKRANQAAPRPVEDKTSARAMEPCPLRGLSMVCDADRSVPRAAR